LNYLRRSVTEKSVRRAFSLLCFWALCTASAHALGGDEARVALSLNWMRFSGAESCMDAGEVARNVERHLGRQVFVSPAVATRIIEAWIEPARPGWRVGLRASNANGDPLGQRELTSADASCSSLDRAIVIAIGLLAQAAEGATVVEAEPLVSAHAPLPQPAPVSVPPPVFIDRPTLDSRSTSDALRAELGPALDVGWGVLPRTALGIGMRTAIHLPRWGTFDFGSRLWLPQSTGNIDAFGSFSRVDLAAGLCPVATARDGARLAVCAGLTAGLMTAQGTGSGGSDSVNRPLLEAYGRLLGLLRVFAPLWVTGSATLGAPFTRWTFFHRRGDGSEADVWSVPALSGAGEVGMLLHLGP
jgi:hypothetical protein